MTADRGDTRGSPCHGGRTGCAGWPLRWLEILPCENVRPQLRVYHGIRCDQRSVRLRGAPRHRYEAIDCARIARSDWHRAAPNAVGRTQGERPWPKSLIERARCWTIHRQRTGPRQSTRYASTSPPPLVDRSSAPSGWASVGAREVLYVRFGSAPEVKDASPEKRDDVAGATGSGDFCDKTLVRIPWHQALGFLDSLPHHCGVELSCDGSWWLGA